MYKPTNEYKPRAYIRRFTVYKLFGSQLQLRKTKKQTLDIESANVG